MAFELNTLMAAPETAKKPTVNTGTDTGTEVNTTDAAFDLFASPEALSNFDFSKTTEFENIPAGTYLTRVSRIDVKLSTKNSPFAVVYYDILDGDYANRKEVETFFFKKNDGTTNDFALRNFNKVVAIINKISSEEAGPITQKILQAFIAGGKKDLTIEHENGIPKDNIVKLSITIKEGKNQAGEVVEYRTRKHEQGA